MNSISRPRLALVLSSLVLLSLAVLPALASAQLQTVDFESGVPLGSPIDSAGEISFLKGPGFRPYRVDVGARAHSGTAVGDLGRCLEESEDAPSCEFFHARAIGQLARTADRVTLFAGMFNGQNPAEMATLTAFRADGSVAATSGPVAIDAGGFDQELSVSSPAGDIASFKIEASRPSGDPAGDLGIDDLEVRFADGAKPDFSVAGSGEVVALVQGQQVDVPLTFARVNGSNGPIQVSVTGLPKGVSATVTPNPVPATQTNATVTLKAAPDAPDTAFVPTDATITADPQGATDVGPGPRTTTQSVRVAANFGLAIGDQSDTNLPAGGRVVVEVPDCAPIEVPVKISRDIAANQDIALSVRGDFDASSVTLQEGMTGAFLPNALVQPGGGLIAERTLRLAATNGAFIPQIGAPAAIEGKIGTGPGAATHVLPLKLLRTPVATIGDGPGADRVETARYGQEGTRVRIHGTGFCPGTSVEVGNEKAVAPATVVDDHTLEFTTPRYATTGPVTIVPPTGLSKYPTSDALTVDSFRNTDAFQFENPKGGDLSLAEFTEAFSNDIFIRVNLCWPFGECSAPTGILHPVAAIEWGVIDKIFADDGHCFGVVLGSMDLRSGKVPYGRLVSRPESGSSHVFDIPGPQHPSGSTGSFLDVEQVKQYSDEYIRASLHRDTDLLDQLSILEAQFRHNRGAMVSVKQRDSNGHDLYAYDMSQTPTSADIYVWDPSRPFHPSGENSIATLHKSEIDEGVIHVDKATPSWKFTLAYAGFSEPKVWSGRDDGSLWVEPEGTVPDHSTLPGLATLASYLESITFGSTHESVRAVGGSPGAEYLPASDGVSGSAAATDGTWINSDRAHPLDVHFVGTKDGAYSQAYSSPGFVAAALNVQTAKGVHDAVQGNDDSLTFASGTDRPLRLEVAKESNSGSEAATLATTASAGGTDSAGLTDGALTYAHDGAPTTLRFSLTKIHRAGGPATFVSGPVRVRGGEHLSVEPVGRGMAHMRLTIRGERGGTRTRLLRNRGSAHRRLRLSRPKLAGHRLSLRFQLAGVRGRAIAGATLRLLRGGRVVAQRSLTAPARHGAGRVAWHLPRKLGRGRYRLLADVRGVTVGGRGLTAAANLSGHRAGVVRLGG